MDNSEWMRNGDYAPRRLDAQQDAGDTAPFIKKIISWYNYIISASMLCNDRTSSNPENTVGLLTMAGPG